MNYSKMIKYDCNNWEGINATIFFSGCTHRCEGCFNKEIWDFNAGYLYHKKSEDKFMEYVKDPHVHGVCILGGEPFQQNLELLYSLVKRIKDETNKPIHVWTGYLIEELENKPECLKILEYIDTLVDGKFDQTKMDKTLKFRGSSNQRVINMYEYLKK